MDAASVSTDAASASTDAAVFWVMDANGFFWNIDSNVGTRGTRGTSLALVLDIVLDVEVICKVVVPRAMQVAVRCDVGECSATEPKD